jgi:tripartite-type tricarboxylate transporter receptor subunit TctC
VFATLVGVASAAAQTYPSRPITMVAPYAAGGPTDTIARIMAERMRVPLGQTILVENTTGQPARSVWPVSREQFPMVIQSA